MNQKKIFKNSKGQVLVPLLFILAVATLVILSVFLVTVIQTQSGFNQRRGNETSQLSESCLELTILNLLRDPQYNGGTLQELGGSCIIEIAGTNPKTVKATGNFDNRYFKTAEAQVSFDSLGRLTIISWKK